MRTLRLYTALAKRVPVAAIDDRSASKTPARLEKDDAIDVEDDRICFDALFHAYTYTLYILVLC